MKSQVNFFDFADALAASIPDAVQLSPRALEQRSGHAEELNQMEAQFQSSRLQPQPVVAQPVQAGPISTGLLNGIANNAAYLPNSPAQSRPALDWRNPGDREALNAYYSADAAARGLKNLNAPQAIADTSRDALGAVATGGNALFRTANMGFRYSPLAVVSRSISNLAGVDDPINNISDSIDDRLKSDYQSIAGFESEEMQRQRQAVNDAKGVQGTVDALIHNPRAFAHLVGEQLPQLGLMGKLTKVVMAGRTGAEAILAAAAANRVMSGVLNAGDAGTSAQDAMYQHAIENGATEQEARDAAARARMVAAPIGGASGFLISGIGAKAEGALVARMLGTEGVEHLTTQQAIKQLPVLAAKEFTEEALDEGLSSQMASNIGEIAAGNKDRGLMDDVGKSAALGGMLGLATGGGMNAVEVLHSKPAQTAHDLYQAGLADRSAAAADINSLMQNTFGNRTAAHAQTAQEAAALPVTPILPPTLPPQIAPVDLPQINSSSVEPIERAAPGGKTDSELLDSLVANGVVPAESIHAPEAQQTAPVGPAVEDIVSPVEDEEDEELRKEEEARILDMWFGEDYLASNDTEPTHTEATHRDITEQSPNFKTWFGDWESNPVDASKVVDSSGKPMIVYHGTSQADANGDAFHSFFTTDPSVTSSYSAKGEGESPSVHPAYLNIKNPLDIDAKANPASWSAAFNGIEDYHTGGDTNESWYRAAEDLVADQQVPKYEGAEIMQSALRGMGYDGITRIGSGRVNEEGVKHREYVAFDPEQVKSAIGNNGDFNSATPDILRSESSTHQGSSIQDIHAALINEFGDKGAKLLESGNVAIIQNEHEAPAGSSAINAEEGGNASPQAFFDPKTNKVFLVADGLQAKDVRAVMLHEAFHWMEANKPQSAKLFMNRILAHMNDALRTDNGTIPKWFREAWRQVPADTPHQHVLSEIAAYTVTNRAGAPVTMKTWINDFVSNLRVALIRMGWSPSKINAADFAALARVAVRQMSNSENIADKAVNLIERARNKWGEIQTESLEQAVKHSANDNYHPGPVTSLWQKIASMDGAFETPRTNKADLNEAIREVIPRSNFTTERVERLDVPKEGRSAPGYVVRDADFNKVLQVFDADSARPFIEIGNANVSIGSGLGKLYQALAGWANSNGKTLRSDPRGLSTINEIRRSEQIISAMLKYDNSGMFDVDGTQFAGLLSEADYQDYQQYGKTDSIVSKLDALKHEYWGDDQSPHTSRALTDARINNLSLAVAALAKRRAPGEFENAILDSKGNVRTRDSEGRVVILQSADGSGKMATRNSGAHLLGVGYSVRQRAYATLQSVFGGKTPVVVDESSLRRAGVLQSIGQEATPHRNERAGLLHPRQDALAESRSIRLYSQQTGTPSNGGFSLDAMERTGWDSFIENFQDRHNLVNKMQQEIQAATGVPIREEADVYSALKRMPGRIATKLEDFESNEVRPLVQRLAQSGYSLDDLSQLLQADHAQERNEHVARINPAKPDGGSGMTNAEAAAIQAHFANATELQAIAADVRAMARKTLDEQYTAGLIDQDTYDTLAGHYTNYVPLKGDLGDEATQGGGISTSFRQQRATGHDARAELILENIARDRQLTITRTEHSVVGKALLRLVTDMKSRGIDLGTVDVIPKRNAVTDRASYIVEYHGSVVGGFKTRGEANAFIMGQAGKKGRKASDFEVKAEYSSQVVARPLPMQDNEIRVYVGGRGIRIQMDNLDVGMQLRALNIDQLGTALEVMSTINRHFARVYTGLNPTFIVKNAMRDFTSGVVNVLGNEGGKVAASAIAHYPGAAKALMHHSSTGAYPATKYGQYLKEYRESGGKIGASFISDLESLTSSIQSDFDKQQGFIKTWNDRGNMKDGFKRTATVIGDRLFGKLAHFIEIGTGASENAFRLSTFIAMREAGSSVNKAANMARNATVDFDTRGTKGRLMGAIWLFTNPRIQGTANIAKTLLHGEHKAQAWAALSTLPVLAYVLASIGMKDDKNKWLGRSWDDRSGNMIIQIGGKPFKIPFSQEFKLFYGFGVAAAEMEHGEASGMAAMTAAATKLGAAASDYIPIGKWMDGDDGPNSVQTIMSLVPQALKPAAAVGLNINDWGDQIVPDYGPSDMRPDNLRMNSSTKGTSFDYIAQGIKRFGVMLGIEHQYDNGYLSVSPESIKYLFSTMTGGLGSFLSDSADFATKTAQGAYTKDGESIAGNISNAAADAPVIKAFYPDDEMKALRRSYFREADKAKELVSKMDMARKDHNFEAIDDLRDEDEGWGELSRIANLVKQDEKRRKALTNLKVKIQMNSDYSAAEKRDKLKELEEREMKIYRRVLNSR